MIKIQIPKHKTPGFSIRQPGSSAAFKFRAFKNSNLGFVSDFDIRYLDFDGPRLRQIERISPGPPTQVNPRQHLKEKQCPAAF